MSYKHYDEVWNLKLSATETMVLLVIAKHANKDGIAWPSVARIAALSSLTERGVYKILKRLKAKGMLLAIRKNHYVIYQLNIVQELTEPVTLPTEPWTVPTEPDSPEYVIEGFNGIDKVKAATQQGLSTKNLKTPYNNVKQQNNEQSMSYGFIETIWKQELQNLTGTIIVPLTLKEKSALKTWCNKFGGNAADDLKAVMNNWYGFRNYLFDEGVEEKIPKWPSVMHLAKYPQFAQGFLSKCFYEKSCDYKIDAPKVTVIMPTA